MSIFKSKESKETEIQVDKSLEDQISEQANKLGLKVGELKSLGQGKSCPKYGTTELLHARRTRNGKITVFNISEKFRGEKISVGRKNMKAKKEESAVDTITASVPAGATKA